MIQRLKTWAVEGLDCETRDDHVNFSGDIAFRPVGKLLSQEDLEEKCPKQVINRNLSAAGAASTKPKAKAAGKSKPNKASRATGKAKGKQKKSAGCASGSESSAPCVRPKGSAQSAHGSSNRSASSSSNSSNSSSSNSSSSSSS